jgi:hypothetical protein
MLYQTPDLKLLHEFVAFARTKRANKRFYYYSLSNCACAQFIRHRENRWSTPLSWHNNPDYRRLNSIAARASWNEKPTWGQLVKEIENEIETVTHAYVPPATDNWWAEYSGENLL